MAAITIITIIFLLVLFPFPPLLPRVPVSFTIKRLQRPVNTVLSSGHRHSIIY
ncbi:hypothetical protein K435DRAFT_781475 [Dendrothele bispora CBS 962.96]|uniref:Uncharacterized protein n=1 Tax=Dendrothele bispora (strain CBS 962.96) TaxID=1314807 RepID=A0A4S8LKT9_DENBC|nr:hypothetical protein K435DRAFT_781475 [Dendrothele bispora CBS 962.96]